MIGTGEEEGYKFAEIAAATAASYEASEETVWGVV